MPITFSAEQLLDQSKILAGNFDQPPDSSDERADELVYLKTEATRMVSDILTLFAAALETNDEPTKHVLAAAFLILAPFFSTVKIRPDVSYSRNIDAAISYLRRASQVSRPTQESPQDNSK